jgi:hypothetical protein
MSKSLFMEVAQVTSNHYDKALEKYYRLQNADYRQINQIKGIKTKWK